MEASHASFCGPFLTDTAVYFDIGSWGRIAEDNARRLPRPDRRSFSGCSESTTPEWNKATLKPWELNAGIACGSACSGSVGLVGLSVITGSYWQVVGDGRGEPTESDRAADLRRPRRVHPVRIWEVSDLVAMLEAEEKGLERAA